MMAAIDDSITELLFEYWLEFLRNNPVVRRVPLNAAADISWKQFLKKMNDETLDVIKHKAGIISSRHAGP